MTPSTCTCKIVSERAGIGDLSGEFARIEKCALCLAAPAMYEALENSPTFGGAPKTAFGREYAEWQRNAWHLAAGIRLGAKP